MQGCLKIDYDCSSKDEVTKEKLGPFATLSDDESYQSRDLEKVCDPIYNISKNNLLYTCIIFPFWHRDGNKVYGFKF
jgi:hypothetical protein